MRALFIAVGVVAIDKFKPVLLVFAGILVFSSGKMLLGGGGEEENFEENKVVQLAMSLINSTAEYDGDKFWTKVDGVSRATPLLLVLACIELSDIVFAIDSIPAVFGVTKDPFIVFTSNIAAILGLRWSNPPRPHCPMNAISCSILYLRLALDTKLVLEAQPKPQALNHKHLTPDP